MDPFGDTARSSRCPTPIEDFRHRRRQYEPRPHRQRCHGGKLRTASQALPDIRRRGIDDGRRGSVEARRACTELGAGGIQIFTNVAGKPPGDPSFEPIFKWRSSTGRSGCIQRAPPR
jgi:hypothetical protein